MPARATARRSCASPRRWRAIAGRRPPPRSRRNESIEGEIHGLHAEQRAERLAGDGAQIRAGGNPPDLARPRRRSEEHTSELQSLRHLVCRLLLEKKKEHTTDIV